MEKKEIILESYKTVFSALLNESNSVWNRHNIFLIVNIGFLSIIVTQSLSRTSRVNNGLI